ncbi:MBL fold metallo-hydrolase [Dyadobacter sp. NIV53]|uniref:MBL fold metallo-hydrolase n=1 Tax=Dyadobacter sp. NIV53 TaxID=2861765 RepID=UPI001C885083|nr:MBL fold metallo-hydrolase [Dyadobacter sp. NIV53]
MSNSRRAFIRKSIVLATVGINLPASFCNRKLMSRNKDRLVLLGTQGGPFIRSFKQTPSSSLIVYKGIPIVVDTGYGVTLKLREAGIELPTLRYIFITHHHSDHNLELGPLLYNAWLAGMKDTIHVYAPAGIKELLVHYWESNRFDLETRIQDEGRPDIRKLVTAHVLSEGEVLANSGFTVEALRNIHPPIENSFALKFKLGGTIVVFSGDTAYFPALARFASNSDYLIHEAMFGPAVDEMVKRRPNASKLKASILSHHTLAEDVGKIAKQANAKRLILNHFVPPDDKTLTDQVWIDAVRTNFSGEIIVGKDLLEFLF